MRIINTKALGKGLFRGAAIGGGALLTAAAFSPAVSAQTAAAPSQTYQVTLTQANKSGASGTATLSLNGSNLTATIRGTGFSPNLAHATHIHVGGSGSTPADSDKDGYVNAKEAEAAAGPVKVSLTTSGDTGPASALAVDRMPKANAQGALTYNRTFALPAGVTAADMQRASIDIHGISTLFNDKAKYDGTKKSDLDNKLAFEITVPAASGKLTTSPTGGAATGVGSINGMESSDLIFGATAALAAAAALAYVARKQLMAQK